MEDDKIKLPQLKGLRYIDNDITNSNYGFYYNERPINVLMDYGFILLDKPSGPTSHEVVAWVKRLLAVEKAGHSGTLDPGTTGLLPMGLGEATKALSVLLIGPKEYYALARLHSYYKRELVESLLKSFIGDIYQKPPQRSSVKRATRIRTIYSMDFLEQLDNLILMRIVCQSGTYIRKIIYDIGEILSSGASMIELRRTAVSNFDHKHYPFTTLHQLADSLYDLKEKGEEQKIRDHIFPIEVCLDLLPSVIIRDTAVDALCHGAQLAMPGVLAFSNAIKKGDLTGIYTLKGEIVGLGELIMDKKELEERDSGVAFAIRRIIMKPGTYPKAWRKGKGVQPD